MPATFFPIEMMQKKDPGRCHRIEAIKQGSKGSKGGEGG